MKLQDFDFRIWDSENKALIYNTGSVVGLNPDVHEIELWTGLRDIDGEKIFEGDIVQSTSSNLKYSHIYEVLYSAYKARYFFKIKENYSSNECCISVCIVFGEYLIKDYGIKVVGNIHETKEFL